MKVDVIGLDGSVKDSIEINGILDKIDPSKESIYYKVISENANIHIGTATTKGRSQVRGGGRKPWRQKHTGRARHGSIRSPIWRGGGVAFGNQRKNYKFQLPLTLKKKALLSFIKLKVERNELKVIDDFTVDTPKSKSLLNKIANLLPEKGKVVFIVDKLNDEMKKAVSNIKNIEIVSVKRLVLRKLIDIKNIYITKEAIEYINSIEI